MGVKRGVVRTGWGKAAAKAGKRKGWSKAAIAAAKACSGIKLAQPGPVRNGRRGASIARVVKAYYLG